MAKLDIEATILTSCVPHLKYVLVDKELTLLFSFKI